MRLQAIDIVHRPVENDSMATTGSDNSLQPTKHHKTPVSLQQFKYCWINSSLLRFSHLYINLRRSRDCLCVSVADGGRLRLFVCVIALLHLLILRKCYAVHINALSLLYESVHRKKHYTRGNNTIPYKLARLVTFESLKWKYSFATNSTLFMKLGSLLYARCRHRSLKSTAVSNKTFFSS